MLKIQSFTFNPFAENTYLIWDEDTLDCTIFDPGCSDSYEENVISSFIEKNKLNLNQLVNTHCHIDHVLGNKFIHDNYKLDLKAHKLEEAILEFSLSSATLYNIPYTPSPPIHTFLNESETIKIGEHELEIRFTPGHSPGSLTFVCHQQQFAIVGDLIFYQSIGRTDLPGGDYNVIENSIRKQIYTLPDNYTLYNGHGQSTNVGHEKKHNNFINENY